MQCMQARREMCVLCGKGPGCDEGTNLRLRDFVVVPLMPTRVYSIICLINFYTVNSNTPRL